MTDEELYTAMTALYQEQQRCLRLQKKLMYASMICFIVGFIPIVMNMVVSMTWANRLEDRAASLVGYKYRFVLYAPYVLSNGGRRWLSRNPWRDEAKRLGDDLAIHLMDFYDLSFGYISRSILGLVLMWMIATAFCEITGIDILSHLP